MPEWTQNPHAAYVLAAYAIAAVALIGLAVASWHAWRCRAKEWQQITQDEEDSVQ